MEKSVRIIFDIIINPDATYAAGFNMVKIGTEEKFSKSLEINLKKGMSWIELVTEVSKPTYEFIQTIPNLK